MSNFLNPERVPDRDTIESALRDFGFYHEFSDVQRMYAEYVNNKRYGYPGAVLDQPDAYWHDMSMMRFLELWVEHFAPLVGFTDEVSIFEKARRGERLM